MDLSPDTTTPVLVIGARGSVGRHVLAELLERGVPVRASSRSPRPGDVPDGVDLVAADLTDPATLPPAFTGVGRVFLYAEHRGAQGVVDAARTAGVSRVVLLSSGSVIHPTSRGNAITEEHRQVEDVFTTAVTPLAVPVRPLVLATGASAWARSIASTGSVALYRPDAMTAPVHERDVAAVAVAALLGRDDASGLLTGPTRLTQREQVAAVAAATGQDATVDELSRDEALAHFGRFVPPGEARAVVDFLDDAAAGNSPATGEVERLLGRPALPFSAWAAEHAAEFRR